MKQLLLFMRAGFAFAGILLFCGCGDVKIAAGRLAAEQKKLARIYLDGVVADQIRLNPEYQVWSLDSGRIFLAGYDGTEIFNRRPQDKLLDEYAIARFYSAQELELRLLAFSLGKVTPYKHARYTYRSYIKLSIEEKRRLWQHKPGASVGTVGIKGVHNTDDLKKLLADTVSKNLPGVDRDYIELYRSAGNEVVRKYDVLCFVCYDPGLPGWVLEEPGKQEKTPASAEWLTRQSALPEKIEEYDRRLFWKDSLVIRQNYDRGLVLYLGKWMKAEIAEKCRQLAELIKQFSSNNCTLLELQEFLTQCAAFPPECDRKEAFAKALEAGRIFIAARQNNIANAAANLRELQQLRNMLNEEPLFAPLSSLLAGCNNAIQSLLRAYNRKVDNDIAGLRQVQNNVLDLFKRTNERDQKVMIVLARQQNIWQKTVPLDSKNLDAEVDKMLLFRALLEDKIRTPAELYRYIRKSSALKKLLPEVLRDCEVCRKGKVSCDNCTTLAGKCRRCRGEKFVNNDFCPLCRGSGNCDSCFGTRYKKCLSCNGRGFFIRKKAVETLQQKSFDEFSEILQYQINRLEAQKLRDE